MNDSDTKQSTECNQQMERTLTSSLKQSPGWSTPSDISQLERGDVVLHENCIARVTFICPRYIVVTPKDMQYGILVFPETLHRIKFLSQ